MELEKQDNIDQHTFQFREDNEALVAKIRPAETVTPSASFIEETRRRDPPTPTSLGPAQGSQPTPSGLAAQH